MSNIFNCFALLCLVCLVTSQQQDSSTTIRPSHHRHMHHDRHKHNRTQITIEDTDTILPLLPVDTAAGVRPTKKPSMPLAIRSQKLFLINSDQQPTLPSALATSGFDGHQPNFSPRWPSTLNGYYPSHNPSHNHRPTTMDLGYNWRTAGTRTFYADAPYTTTTVPSTMIATVAGGTYRPEHRFSGKPHIGYDIYIIF